MMGALRIGTAALILGVLLAAAPVAADEPADRDAARKAAVDGLERFRNEDYRGAIERLAAAEALFHAPPHLLYMARAHAALGEYGKAYALLVDALMEALAENAPAAFRDAQVAARTELSALEPRVAGVRVELEGPTSDVQIFVDDEQFALERLAYVIPLPPGNHVIRATRGTAAARQVVTITANGPPVPVRLAPTEEAPPPPPPLHPAPARNGTSQDGGTSGPLVAGLVVGGVGIVGLTVGTITGAMTLSRADDIKSRCTSEGQCFANEESEIDSAKTLGTVSTIGFIAGGVSLALGATLMVVGVSDGETEDALLDRSELLVLGDGLLWRGAF